MEFKVKFSISIERSDALERALQDLQVGTDNQSQTDQDPDVIEDDAVVGFGFAMRAKP